MPKPATRKDTNKKDGDENKDKAQDGGEDDELSPAMTKAMKMMTANISKMIDSKLESFLGKLGGLAQELQDNTKRVEEAEQRISTVEDSSNESVKRIAYLEKTVAQLLDRFDMQEDRSRRQNLRILGIPDKSEGVSAVQFMETWIPKILGLTTKAGRIKLEGAHRIVGFAANGAGTAAHRKPYPKVMIVRFHNFCDRARVMDAARRMKNIQYEGNKIHFYQDFSAGTQKRRRAFDETRRELQAVGVRDYGLSYPATLRITANNLTKSFNNPKDALTFVSTLRGEGRSDPLD